MAPRISTYFTALLIICLGFSSASADAEIVPFDQEFKISPGLSVAVAGGLGFIKFQKVLEDSRCPVNVTCVWAGNVKSEFEILDADGNKRTIFLNTGVKPNQAFLQGFSLQLLAIHPAKVEGVKIVPESYQATLRMSRSR